MNENENPNGAQIETTEKSPTSAIISIIVIVIVLAAGAFYFLGKVPVSNENSDGVNATEFKDDTVVSALATQGTSTKITDIQKDLNATDLSGFGTGLTGISI